MKISPDDVRQLTVYSELLKRGRNLALPPDMTIFYPSLSVQTPQSRRTWNGAILWLCPVKVRDFETLSTALS